MRATRIRTWVVSLALLVVGAASVLFRVGSAGWRGVIWAEDGGIFLTGAYHAGFGVLLHPYNGYALVMNRLVAAVIAGVLPIGSHGVALDLTAAFGQAALALLARHAVSWLARSSWAGWVVWAYVLFVPVGPETGVNIANLQWPMLAVACLAICWVPKSRAVQTCCGVVVALLATSCPFGAVTIGVAALAWFVTRNRYHLSMTFVALASSAVQWAVMAGAPSRAVSTRVDLVALLGGFFHRVVADGFWGIPALGSHSYDGGWWRIAVPVSLWLGLLAIGVRERRREVLLPLGLIALAGGIYAVPTTLGGTEVANPYYSARYFVAPAILAVTSLVILAVIAIDASRGLVRLASLGAVFVIVLGLSWGALVSYQAPSVFRPGGPTWSAGLTVARRACGGSVKGVAAAPIAPRPWQVAVPCRLLKP